MTTSFWLVACLACAQVDQPEIPANKNSDHDIPGQVERIVPLHPAASKIVAVTVYQGQALVTREVKVPGGNGTIELVVTPLPTQTVDNSLHTEGRDGLRVLSTRFRTRAIKEDTRREVLEKEKQLKTSQADIQRLEKEIAVQEDDLRYLHKLENFTDTTLNGLTEKGRLDSEAILTLSKFVMDKREAKTKTETDLRQQLQATNETAEFARRQLAELSAGSSRVERDAVILVHRTQAGAGTVSLTYLVGAASWSPRYRLQGGAPADPVRLEYLASVMQQTGEPWSGVRVTLSTSRPSLDAAPPELMPLKMAIAGEFESEPIEAKDDRSQRIASELEKLANMPFKDETPLEDVIKYVRGITKNPSFPEGIPIYLDPVGLSEAEKTAQSPISIDVSQVPLRTALKALLAQLGMTYIIKDGMLTITSSDSEQVSEESGRSRVFLADETAGMGGMHDQTEAAGGARLNREAANDQAEELNVAEKSDSNSPTSEKETPSVTFPIDGNLDIPSRRDPQLLEVARVDLEAEYYAKAVPVLTPRVYRLAKLTNKSDIVLLPGEATVYVAGDFVGRMRLPLVAAGEPFIAGFGVDSQLQVSRRLLRKSRVIQGGNQIFDYEFRIGLRNYRPGLVKVQLWDRLPKPEGEAVAVNLVKTSTELSSEALYLRTARMDNLLRWDVDVPPGTVGEKTMYLAYQFRIEYARDLPQPSFISGGLREGPIGGGAMGLGGMGGGMGGGMQSLKVTPD